MLLKKDTKIFTLASNFEILLKKYEFPPQSIIVDKIADSDTEKKYIPAASGSRIRVTIRLEPKPAPREAILNTVDKLYIDNIVFLLNIYKRELDCYSHYD